MSPVTNAPSVLARVERFERVASTNDIVRAWLDDGEPEVCAAVAGEQTAGRGRLGRTWTAPPGAALLVSLGFRPSWLAVDRVWRIPAIVSLAMADAAEDIAGLPVGAIRLKWPNDLVIETAGPNALLMGELDVAAANAVLKAPVELRKVAGVLGETDGLGTDDPRVVVGIGVNGDWAAADFPAELAPTMTSLREASAGRPIEAGVLFAAFVEHLEARVEALRAGFFDLSSWATRQATTGRLVLLDEETSPVLALGVDAATGGLVVDDPAAVRGERVVHAGEVLRVRVAGEDV